MGLDNYWILPKGKCHPTFKPKLRLCGGMFSGHGVRSFRGKVYDDFIELVTGETLYQIMIPNKKIKKMAKLLEERGDALLDEKYGVCWHDLYDLQQMFKKYARLGASLQGGW